MKKINLILIILLFALALIGDEIYFDGFEEESNWQLTGEFEIGIPNGLGGEHGNADPMSAYEGINVLGVDLSGYGNYPGDYENNLTEDEYKAISPSIDCSEFIDVNLSFMLWLGVEQPAYDHAYIKVSNDNGNTWITIWENSQTISDNSWHEVSFDISEYADLHSNVKIAYSIGPTDGSWQYCGWNIDNFTISGNHIQYGSIQGIVTNLQTQQPLSDVLISSNYGITYSDSSGFFILQNLPAININFTVSTFGYQTLFVQNIQIPANDTLIYNFELTPLENVPPSPTNLIADVEYNTVHLSWSPPEESENYFIAYNVYRDNINIFTTNETYFDDTNLVLGEYSYYITAYYDVGSSLPSNTVTVQVTSVFTDNNELPLSKVKLTNYPNPFNPTTTISFTSNLHAKNPIIEIYNLKGQLIKRFEKINPVSDFYQVIWNGKDNNDNDVPSGIYLYKLKTSQGTITKKMILIK